jgi:hypothetical protein
VDLVDLFGRRWLAVSLGAIILSRLAARLTGIRVGLAPGKRPDLSLAGTEGGVEFTAEPLVLGLQVADPSLKGLAVALRSGSMLELYAAGGRAAAPAVGEEEFSLSFGANQIPQAFNGNGRLSQEFAAKQGGAAA